MTTETQAVSEKPFSGKREMSFRFKKDKLGNQRPTVKFDGVPVPSFGAFLSILEAGGKQLELLEDAAADVIRSVLAEFVSENEAINPETFDYSTISWEAIANMPKQDRRVSTIPAETWQAFVEDYTSIMVSMTGKSKEAVELACEIYVKKMAPVKTNKKALGKLQEQLAIYSSTNNAENFAEILELLVRRCETYLKADDPQILAENL
jgi:hypothetical protein